MLENEKFILNKFFLVVFHRRVGKDGISSCQIAVEQDENEDDRDRDTGKYLSAEGSIVEGSALFYAFPALSTHPKGEEVEHL